LKKLKPLLQTQVKREDAVKRLEELALEAHDNCMNKDFEAWERLRWARIEAYVYQVINTVLRTYDNVVIEQKNYSRIEKLLEEGYI